MSIESFFMDLYAGLSTVGSLLPATVIAAIALFAAKELLEVIRRWRADRRKRHAIRTLLAYECERNNWSIKKLKEIFSEIINDLPAGVNFTLFKDAVGVCSVRQDRPDGGWGMTRVPDIHDEAAKDLLMQSADVDKKVFSLLLQASEELKVLGHLRSSLLRELQPDERGFNHLEGFADYGLGELDDIYKSLNALYRACTGTELVKHRIR